MSRKQKARIGTLYFEWLYSQVMDMQNTNLVSSFSHVCMHLHSVEFNDSVPYDENRTKEGLELREEFIAAHSSVIDIEDYAELHGSSKATVLEMMIALARRAALLYDPDRITAQIWFGMFLDNLRLTMYNDAHYRASRDDIKIARIVARFNNRTYAMNGRGGMFPLRKPRSDQRNVELWFQMGAYMTENNLY